MSPLILSIIKYKYILLIPISIVEGPIIMMISGLLIKLGYLQLVPALLCLLFGDLLGDIIWYFIGYFWGHRFIKKFGKYVNVSEENVSFITHIFHKYKDRILFISKITAGFGLSLATLITAGMVKIPLKRFLLINFFGEIVWTSMCMSVGYFFGHAYTSVSNIGSKVAIIGAGIVLFACIIGFGKFIRRRLKTI